MGDKKMLTAKDFAAQTGISYPVIIEWLKTDKLPGAEQTTFNVWQIPSSLVAHYSKEEYKP